MKLHYDQLLTDPVTAVISFCDSKGNAATKGESCYFDNYCYIATREASNSSMLLTTYCYNSCRTMFDHIYLISYNECSRESRHRRWINKSKE